MLHSIKHLPDKALDIFEELCMNANESTIKESCRILTEAENKVRDQTQLMRSLKNRFARIKHKTEYNITKAHNTVTSNIYSSISNLQNTLKGASGGIAKANTVNVAKECFQELEDQCSLITECDRILRNYATISRRFNLDKVVSNIYRSSDSYQACFEIASYIDTYNQPFKNRYNSALEMTAYLFDKHFMNYPKEMIVEAVTDYFLFTGVCHACCPTLFLLYHKYCRPSALSTVTSAWIVTDSPDSTIISVST